MFDGQASPNNDAIAIGDPADGSLDFGTGSFSYSVWVYVTSSAGQYDMSWFKGGSSAATIGYDFELGTSAWAVNIADGSTTHSVYLDDESSYLNQWVHLVGVVDRGTNLFSAYVNGTPYNSVDITSLGSVSNNYSATIGSHPTGTYPFSGKIDEVRVSGTAITADWIATEYNNQSDTAVGSDKFIRSVGPEEAVPWWDSGWQNRKTFTINADLVGANSVPKNNIDLVNMPVLFSFTDAEIGGNAQTSGKDIAFTLEGASSKLDHELVSFDNTTGDIIVWVKIPAILKRHGATVL
jgi:hypothetical protein